MSSIDFISVDDVSKIISVHFKPLEGEYIPEISSGTINIDVREYTDKTRELESYKIELIFPLIQVIKKLNESDQYFIKNITTIRDIQVFCGTVQDGGGGEYNYVFVKTEFDIYLNNLLLINSTFNGEIIPIESTDLLRYGEDEELFAYLYSCLYIDSSTDIYISLGLIECVNCYYYISNSHTSLIISGDIPPELTSSRYLPLIDKDYIHIYMSSINKPPVSNITGLPIPINTSGDNASSIDLSGITF